MIKRKFAWFVPSPLMQVLTHFHLVKHQFTCWNGRYLVCCQTGLIALRSPGEVWIGQWYNQGNPTRETRRTRSDISSFSKSVNGANFYCTRWVPSYQFHITITVNLLVASLWTVILLWKVTVLTCSLKPRK